MTPQPGWYPDPTDSTQLRYWDGQSWGVARKQQPAVAAGQKIQDVGNGIAKVGSSLIWITIGIALLLLLLLLL